MSTIAKVNGVDAPTGVTTFAALTDATIARKSADQTLDQQSTTLQNVTDLLFAVAANEVWAVELVAKVNAHTSPDMKFGWAVPSGTTMIWGKVSASSASAEGDTIIVIGASADRIEPPFRGIIIVSSTAGNIQCQAAQNSSQAEDVKVLANSFIIAHRIYAP